MNNKQKPKVQLVGQNGNVFNLLGICTRALNQSGQPDEAKELKNRVMSCNSYDEVLAIMLEYVDETGDSSDDESNENDFDDDGDNEEDD